MPSLPEEHCTTLKTMFAGLYRPLFRMLSEILTQATDDSAVLDLARTLSTALESAETADSVQVRVHKERSAPPPSAFPSLHDNPWRVTGATLLLIWRLFCMPHLLPHRVECRHKTTLCVS